VCRNPKREKRGFKKDDKKIPPTRIKNESGNTITKGGNASPKSDRYFSGGGGRVENKSRRLNVDRVKEIISLN